MLWATPALLLSQLLAVDGASGDTPTQLTARQIVEGQSLLGDQGDKLAAIVVHPKVYYDLKERRALDMIYDDAGQPDTSAAQGSLANAFGPVAVPTFMGMRVIVSADVQTAGSGATTEYASYMFTQGAVGSGEQLGLQTETDRDILAKSDAMSIDLHYVYHPIGSSFSTSVSNPTRGTTGNRGQLDQGVRDQQHWHRADYHHQRTRLIGGN